MSSVHVFLLIALPACLIRVICVSDANTKLLASTCCLWRQATASQAFGFAACLIAASYHNVGSTLTSPSAPPCPHRTGWQHLSPTDYSVGKPILGTFKMKCWIDLFFFFFFKVLYIQTHHLMKFSTRFVWVSGFMSMCCINLEFSFCSSPLMCGGCFYIAV